MRLGRVLGGAGVLCLCVGAAFAVAPSLVAEAGIGSVLAAVGNGYLLVAGVGVFALVSAVAAGTNWALYGSRQAAMPDRESFVAVDPPGGEFDEAVAELAGQRERAARPVDHREKVRDRLRRDAVRTLVVHRGYDREAAEAAVATGGWTDDRFAADFLAESDDAPRLRWYQRLWRWLRRADPFAVGAARTVDEMRALAEGEP